MTRLPKPALLDPTSGAIPSSVMSTKRGPSFVRAAGGFALPAGAANQVGVMDQGWGGVAMQTPWYLPLPAAGFGSYIPTPPLDVFPDSPASAPFIEPDRGSGSTLAPGFGMGFGLMPWFGPESQEAAARARETNPLNTLGGGMQNTADVIGSGTLGGESFLSDIASFIGDAAQTIVTFQSDPQAALQSIGIIPKQAELTLPTPEGQEMIQTQPESLRTRIGPPPAPGINPLWFAAGGLALLLLLRK